MKESIYKIIAITTILLGALGPQVASGNNINQESSFYKESSPHGSQLLKVVTQIEPLTLAVSNTGSDLNTANCSNSDGLGLMLWQGCVVINNTLEVSKSNTEILVINQPIMSQPQLDFFLSNHSFSLKNLDVSLSKTSSLHPTAGRSVTAFLVNISGLKLSSFEKSYQPPSSKLESIEIYKNLDVQFMNMNIVSMRC